MSKLYKITDCNFMSGHRYIPTKWGENVTHEVKGTGSLCTDGWIHAYTSPIHALIFNCIHANIRDPLLWECEGKIGINDGTKVGCKKLTTIKQVEFPEITLEQRIALAILCVREVCRDPKFIEWSDKYLSGEDRTRESARAVDYAFSINKEINLEELFKLAME